VLEALALLCTLAASLYYGRLFASMLHVFLIAAGEVELFADADLEARERQGGPVWVLTAEPAAPLSHESSFASMDSEFSSADALHAGADGGALSLSIQACLLVYKRA
jgi:hypothetical protein